MFSFLKELDSVSLKPNLRIQGNTLKVKLEELLGFSGSGSIASGSVPGDDNEGENSLIMILVRLFLQLNSSCALCSLIIVYHCYPWFRHTLPILAGS